MNKKKLITKLKTAFDVNTNQKLADKLETTKSTVDSWSRRDISLKYLLKTVELTGVSMEWLTSEDEPKFVFNGSNNLGQNTGSGIGMQIGNTEKEQKNILEFIDDYQRIEKLLYFDDNQKLIKERKEVIEKGLNDIIKELKEYI